MSFTCERISGLIVDCAERVWSQRPSPEYVRRVALLLAETGASESGYAERRQQGFRWDELLIGAWGFWQTESAAAADSLKFLLNREELRQRFERFSGCDVAQLNALALGRTAEQIRLMQTIALNDRLAVALCRIHYLRMPGLIPGDVNGRGAYWKKYYNTALGAGTVEKYVNNAWNNPFVALVDRYTHVNTVAADASDENRLDEIPPAVSEDGDAPENELFPSKENAEVASGSAASAGGPVVHGGAAKGKGKGAR